MTAYEIDAGHWDFAFVAVDELPATAGYDFCVYEEPDRSLLSREVATGTQFDNSEKRRENTVPEIFPGP